MKLYTFLFIIFIVSFISDIVLNDLSHFTITPLTYYFNNKSILICALNAGLTILIATLINMCLSYLLFGFIVPSNFAKLIYFCILAFLVGYILDVFIYKMNIFDGLTEYYNTFGAGLWGALAFIFAIVISYFIQKNILPQL